MGAFGVIPKLFRVDGYSEWMALPRGYKDTLAARAPPALPETGLGAKMRSLLAVGLFAC